MSAPRARRESPDEALLLATGWTRKVSRYRREVRWCDPVTGVYAKSVALAAAKQRRRDARASQAKSMGGAPRRVSDGEVAEWVADYERGSSTLEIAARALVHASTVRAHLMRAGVVMRSPGHRAPRG